MLSRTPTLSHQTEEDVLFVTLTREDEERTWQVRRSRDRWLFRHSWPGHVRVGGLRDRRDVERLLLDFEGEIRAAHADGWR